MSKIPISRLLAEAEERQHEGAPSGDISSTGINTKIVLSKKEKQEIQAVIQETLKIVGELMTLLDSYDRKKDGERSHFGGRSQGQLKKIRGLKNKSTAGYFSIGEKIRIHGLASDEKIQEYYKRIRGFRQNYHATTIKSEQIRNFHEHIQGLVVPLLKKAFK